MCVCVCMCVGGVPPVAGHVCVGDGGEHSRWAA
jgi:hypothetical protein